MLKKLAFLLLWAVPASAQHVFYVSKSAGADTNTSAQAQVKTTPWAHMPGMASCASNCASYTPVAGDQFILKGGDTWVASDLPLAFTWNGTSGSPIYVGVDLTWFTGASWVRPILDCQSTACGGHHIQTNASYVTIDNLEMKGMRHTAAVSQVKGVEVLADHNIVEHNYFHGWSSPGNVPDDGRDFASSAANGAGNQFIFNVVDGQDTSQNMFGGCDDYEVCSNNVIRYVYNGVRGGHNIVAGNLIEHIVTDNICTTPGNCDHANGISIFSPFSGSLIWVYNNVIHDFSLASGAEVLWVHSLGACSTCTSYIYGNIVYNSGRGIDVGDHPPANDGTFYVYNNTVEGGPAAGNGETPPRNIVNLENNHNINSTTLCDSTGVTCNDLGGNLSQTTAQANANVTPHFDQYTALESYVYSPVLAVNSTVGGGTNLTSSCSGNISALCSDTTYATYDSVNHKVVMRTVVARPSSGAWDIGAYQFAGSVTPPTAPVPPMFVKVTHIAKEQESIKTGEATQ
jgi:hypothetical protein